MRAALSIVIPTLNAGDTLPACLAGLMPGVEAGVVRELVISDGGSTDDTERIAEAVGAVWVTGAAGWGDRLSRGVAASQGDWVLVLDPGAVLDASWVDAVRAGMARGGPGYFPLRFRARGLAPRIASAWANLRAGLGRPSWDHALLVSRADYDAAGGYPDGPGMADMALVRALPRPRALGSGIEAGWARD